MAEEKMRGLIEPKGETIYLVFESGSGYGASFNAFTTKNKAMDYFGEVCMERSEFEELSFDEKREVLDAEELQCDDGEVIKIVPLTVE